MNFRETVRPGFGSSSPVANLHIPRGNWRVTHFGARIAQRSVVSKLFNGPENLSILWDDLLNAVGCFLVATKWLISETCRRPAKQRNTEYMRKIEINIPSNCPKIAHSVVFRIPNIIGNCIKTCFYPLHDSDSALGRWILQLSQGGAFSSSNPIRRRMCLHQPGLGEWKSQTFYGGRP